MTTIFIENKNNSNSKISSDDIIKQDINCSKDKINQKGSVLDNTNVKSANLNNDNKSNSEINHKELEDKNKKKNIDIISPRSFYSSKYLINYF